MDRLIGGRFKVVKKISRPSREVYKAVNKNTGEEVAVKLEYVRAQTPRLPYESMMYKRLQGETGIPHHKWYGVEGDYSTMVTDLLGPSLEDLFIKRNMKFSLKTVLMLADQMIQRVECMHSKGILHRDIKPANFLIGKGGSRANLVYVTDYGLAKVFKDPKTREHIKYRENKRFTGSASYASLNKHHGLEQSRRDDLESLGYVLMYFLRGSLPWQGADIEAIIKKKMEMPVEVLCKSYPSEFNSYFRHCRSLNFEAKPDYSLLRELFQKLFLKKGYRYDYVFDWTMSQSTDIGSSSGTRQIMARPVNPVPSTRRLPIASAEGLRGNNPARLRSSEDVPSSINVTLQATRSEAARITRALLSSLDTTTRPGATGRLSYRQGSGSGTSSAAAAQLLQPRNCVMLKVQAVFSAQT